MSALRVGDTVTLFGRDMWEGRVPIKIAKVARVLKTKTELSDGTVVKLRHGEIGTRSNLVRATRVHVDAIHCRRLAASLSAKLTREKLMKLPLDLLKKIDDLLLEAP